MTGRLDVIPSIISDPTAFPYSDWLIICGMAWIQRSFFLWHQVREARADVVWAYKASCNLKSFFKFHRRFLQREMPMVPKLSIPVTDVRDVAGAHITAMTSPKAPGKKPTSIPVFLLFSSFNFRWGTGGKGERAWDWGWEEIRKRVARLAPSRLFERRSPTGLPQKRTLRKSSVLPAGSGTKFQAVLFCVTNVNIIINCQLAFSRKPLCRSHYLYMVAWHGSHSWWGI